MVLKTDEFKNLSFFHKYSDDHLKIISKISTIKEFAVKEMLFEQYDELSDLYILIEGSLSLGISLPHEKRIHLSNIQPGQLISWSAVFEPRVATAWVKATSPAKVMAIDAIKLQNEFKNNCEFGFITISKIAMTISNRLTDTRFQLMNHLIL